MYLLDPESQEYRSGKCSSQGEPIYGSATVKTSASHSTTGVSAGTSKSQNSTSKTGGTNDTW